MKYCVTPSGTKLYLHGLGNTYKMGVFIFSAHLNTQFMIYQTNLPCQSLTETFLGVKRGRQRSRTSSSKMIKLLSQVNDSENLILGTMRFVKTMSKKSADKTQTLNFSKYCTKIPAVAVAGRGKTKDVFLDGIISEN